MNMYPFNPPHFTMQRVACSNKKTESIVISNFLFYEYKVGNLKPLFKTEIRGTDIVSKIIGDGPTQNRAHATPYEDVSKQQKLYYRRTC